MDVKTKEKIGENEGIGEISGGTGIYNEKRVLAVLFISPSSIIKGFKDMVRSRHAGSN